MIFQRKKVVANHEVNKAFDYSKGEVTLKFGLRIDTKEQLQDFRDLLKQAQQDVEAEINNF